MFGTDKYFQPKLEALIKNDVKALDFSLLSECHNKLL